MILLPPDLSVEGVRQGLTTASNGGRGLCTVCSVHAVSVQSGPVQAHATLFLFAMCTTLNLYTTVPFFQLTILCHKK